MRVLWVCNIMLPVIAKQLGESYSVREGWLSGILDRLLDRKKDEIELGICFPVEAEKDGLRAEMKLGKWGRQVVCYGFAQDLSHPEHYEEGIELCFARILSHFKPDLVHIFGTEFPHAYACAKVYHRPERTLVGLQGLMCACARAYMAGLPASVQKSRTLRDRLRHDSMRQQQEKFFLRAAREERLLKCVGHVAGRTPFDKKTVAAINPDAAYHFMNETMRPGFYRGEWEPKHCRRYEIFVSQADYPLKGFHDLLQAMKEILQDYPETGIVVAGNSVLGMDGAVSRLKLPAYGKYLRRLIRENGLSGKVRPLGQLQEEEMKQAFLGCHVFVCPSYMENSPNSVGEAQLLGVPVVASDAGGIPGIVEDGVGGLLYPCGDVHALAQAVKKVFSSDDFARRLGESQRAVSAEKYDGERNYETLRQIYEEIGSA